MIDISSAVKDAIAARKKSFSHDRSKTIGASEIGQCARRIGYEKKIGRAGYDTEYDDTGGMAVRGDVMEDNWTVPLIEATLLKAYGHLPVETRPVLTMAGQADQTTLIADGVPLSATPDGLIINAPRDILRGYRVEDIESDCLVVEMKSIDPRTNMSKLPKDVHVWQVNVQLGLLRKLAEDTNAAAVTEKPKKGKKAAAAKPPAPMPMWGLIVYVDASDYSKVMCFPQRFDASLFQAQLDRAHMMMNAESAELLRPEGKIVGDGQCRYCPFSSRCYGYSMFVPKETRGVPADKLKGMRKLAKDVEAAKAKAEAWERKKSVTEAALKEAIAAAGTKFVRGKDFILSWAQQAGRASWDYDGMKAALAAAGIDVDQFRKEGKPSERLTIELSA